MSERHQHSRHEDREARRSRESYQTGRYTTDERREERAGGSRRSDDRRDRSYSPKRQRRSDDRRDRSYSPKRQHSHRTATPDRSQSPSRHRSESGQYHQNRSRSYDDSDKHHNFQGAALNEPNDGPPGPRHAGPPQTAQKEAPEPGAVLEGRVHTVKAFGVFISIAGYKRHCLVHSSQVAEDMPFAKTDEDDTKIKALEFLAPPGQPVWVKILDVQLDPNGVTRVNGSIKAVSQEDGRDLDPTGKLTARPTGAGAGSDEPPEVNSVHHATVRKVEPYGVFVQLDGFRRYGLVHSSQVSDYLELGKEDGDDEKRAALSGVVSVGDRIWVKVLEVVEGEGERGMKISCSIKLVSQKDGQDLDPTGLRWKPRGEGGRGRDAPIGSEAGTVRSNGVIEWGHLKAGSIQYGDRSKQYDILGNEEERELGQPSASGQVRLPPPPPLPPGMVAPGPGGGMTVEQALAIVQMQKLKGKSKKHKKDKDKKDKDKKKRKEKEHKKKKGKEEKRHNSSSSSD